MRVLLSGASGLIGQALVRHLEARGHDSVRLVRGRTSSTSQEAVWDPSRGQLPLSAMDGVDAVIHLSGANVASGRWTEARKKAILDSRIDSTRLIGDTLRQLERPPKVWLCASATGFYGSRGDEVLTEASAPGSGFLASVCQAWEVATQPASECGIRVCNTRFGAVFSSEGGAFAMMQTPFKLGFGGVIGSGRQWLSWITIHDVIRAMTHLLEHDTVRGPVNLTSPNPVTNAELTNMFGKVLRRPTLLPLPAFVARLAFGQMADEMFLASARVMPGCLLESGFKFEYPHLENAILELTKS